jgi:plastocyanin
MRGTLRGVVRAAVASGLLGLALAVILGACAPAGSGGSSPVTTSAVDLPPSYVFAPTDIAVAPGTTVTWTNNDHFSHSVQFLDGGLPGEPLVMEPGATATFTFDAAGLYHYQCHLHPQNMKGSVTVTP